MRITLILRDDYCGDVRVTGVCRCKSIKQSSAEELQALFWRHNFNSKILNSACMILNCNR